MFVLVLAAEADETRQAITLLIVCLVGIAVMLAALTVWYWLFTSPKRRVGHLLSDLGHFDASMDPGLEQLPESADAVLEEQLVPAGVAAATTAPLVEVTSDVAVSDRAVSDRAVSDIRLGEVQEGTDSTDRSSRSAKLAAAAGPSILSESSDLMSTMLAGSPTPNPGSDTSPPVTADRPEVTADRPPVTADRPEVKADRPEVKPDRPVATADGRLAKAARPPVRSTPTTSASGGSSRGAGKQAPITVPRPKAKPTKPPVRRADVPQTGPPRSTRIEIADRSKQADELAEARRRRARKKRDEEGLSDDDWAAVMKSAFSHLDR